MGQLLDRKLLFVTGKGGVGKSAIASSLGWLGATSDKRTLVCEIDAKGDLASFYSMGPLEFVPQEVRKNLYAMVMNTEESLKEYLRIHLRLPLVARLGPVAKTFDFVANAAPGVKEILTVGKIAYEVREENYDLVVVDSSASGHVVGQLGAANALSELVSVGLVQSQTAWMVELLADPETSGVVVVTTPEEMPVTESLELVDALGRNTDIDLAAVVCNRVLPELFAEEDHKRFKTVSDQILKSGTNNQKAIFAAGQLATRQRRDRSVHQQRLRDGLPDRIPLLNVPFLFKTSHGVRATASLARYLGDEIL